MKQNGTYELLVCADGVDMLGDNTNAVKRVTEALLQGGQERNAQKVKFMSHQQMQDKIGRRKSSIIFVRCDRYQIFEYSPNGQNYIHGALINYLIHLGEYLPRLIPKSFVCLTQRM